MGSSQSPGVPVFYWRDEAEVAETSDTAPVVPSGFRGGPDEREEGDRRVAERREEPQPDHPSGFHFRASDSVEAAGFQWAPDRRASTSEERPRPTSGRPWYLAWFVAKDAQGFQWKDSPGR